MGRFTSLQAILLGGIIAGTIDIGAATLISGRSPIFISQYIAGGLLGRGALEGGVPVALLGLLLQWAMSILIAAIFVMASNRFSILKQNWLMAGIAYGVPVYFVMEYVVVPLSAWHRVPKFSAIPFAENMAAMMVFGVIIAFFSARSQ